MQIHTPHMGVDITFGPEGRVQAIAFTSLDGRPITGMDIRGIRIAELERSPQSSTLVPANPEDPLSAVAEEWLRYLNDGDPYPTKTIAATHGKSVQTAQRWVTNARKAGYLAPGRRGVAR